MKTNKSKILVLTNLNRSTRTTIQSAISLAMIIDGEIELFHVKNPAEVVKTDNQFSALRSIKDEFCSAEGRMQEFITSISKEYPINISHRVAFGNVKSEIEKYLESHNPDLIVLGKRPTKPFQLVGDGITEFIMDHYEGAVLVTAEENVLLPDHPLSIGLLNGAKSLSTRGFLKDILKRSMKPLKVFTIVENTKTGPSVPFVTHSESIEFVFEKDENSVSNLSNYLKKNSVNLLCVERTPNVNDHFVKIVGADLKKSLSKLHVSLLFQGKQNVAVS
jgi:nucleotide-binding universal stress UspA family protein